MSHDEARGEPKPPLDRLFASARAARGLSEVELARLWRRMRPETQAAPSRLASARFGFTTKALVRMALVVGIVCGGTGAVVAARYGLLPGFASPAPAPASSAPPRPARTKGRPTLPRARETALVEPAPVVMPAAPPPSSATADAPVRREPRRAPSWSASAVSPGPAAVEATPATSPPPVVATPLPDLAGESALVTRAFERLRRAHDAEGALAALAMHQQLFPRGLLAREAELGRVEALLILQRDDEALATLERLSFGMRGRDLELRLVRGELRARSNCRHALDDFGAVLAAGREDLSERALYGRAVCLERIGDEDGARAARARYEARHPRGRFAAPPRSP